MKMKQRIGVVGRGFVGSAVQFGFSPRVGCDAEVRVYDVDPSKSTHTLEETVNQRLKDLAPDAPLLQPGETMPQMMQKLLGRETDPRSMIMSTVNEFANLVQQSNFHTKLIQLNDDLIAAGQKPFMFKGPTTK